MKREITCIGCPMGCQLSVEMADGKVVRVEGHTCPRGEAYARQECTAPERMIASLMTTEGSMPISVRTSRPIPKDAVCQCIAEIRATHPKLPVRIGDVLIQDVAGTGVPVIATRTVK